MKRLVLVSVFSLLAGCGGSKIEREPPAPLTDFTAERKVQEIWSVDIGANAVKSGAKLSVYFDGTAIYVSDRRGRVSAYAADNGHELWATRVGQPVTGATGAGSGLVVVATNKGRVIALDRNNGKQLWESVVSSEILAPAAIHSNVVVVQSIDGKVAGLAAADGVAQWLERQGTGYRTPWGVVPIVSAAVVFDLNVGSFDVRPGPKEGEWACEAARPTVAVQGNVGAGTGATVGKWSGIEGRMKGGFGIAEWHDGDLCVQALAVANAVGDVIDHDGSIIAGARASQGGFAAERSPLRPIERGKVPDRTNTTLAVLLTNAGLSKVQCFRLAQRMHDGMSRAVVPVHTSFDGDTTFALSAGVIAADIDLLGECAAQLTSEAIRNAVRHALDAFGIPAAVSAAVRSSGPATSL